MANTYAARDHYTIDLLHPTVDDAVHALTHPAPDRGAGPGP